MDEEKAKERAENARQEIAANKAWLVTHRSLRSLLPMMIWTFITGYAAYYFSISTPAIRIPASIPYLGGIRLGTLWILPVSLAIETIRRYFNDQWVFDNHKITHFKGRISLSYSMPVIKYIHIRAITVTQSLLGRILNYGSIAMGTAGEEGNELTVRGVADPRYLAHLVDLLRLDLERNTNRSPNAPSPNLQVRYGTYDE